ncbi:MAG: hypothetical protein AAFR27_08110, partial [Pseudomonadota bacterium]
LTFFSRPLFRYAFNMGFMSLSQLPPDEQFHQETGVRDVPDFYYRWDDLRDRIVPALQGQAVLDLEQREILYWLIQMADRIGEVDIAPG